MSFAEALEMTESSLQKPSQKTTNCLNKTFVCKANSSSLPIIRLQCSNESFLTLTWVLSHFRTFSLLMFFDYTSPHIYRESTFLNWVLSQKNYTRFEVRKYNWKNWSILGSILKPSINGAYFLDGALSIFSSRPIWYLMGAAQNARRSAYTYIGSHHHLHIAGHIPSWVRKCTLNHIFRKKRYL